jgi:transcription termination factor Rho
MPVLSRGALEASPLADLHTIASELAIDGFRRLRKADLVDAILTRQGGEAGADGAGEPAEGDAPATRPRTRRGGRSRTRVARDRDEDADTDGEADDDEPSARERRAGGTGSRRAATAPTRSRRGGARTEPDADGRDDAEERIADGTIDVLGNGSAFVRINSPEHSDDDVYVSAAQVRRCELVSGDRVTGPVRRPRRSERFASLVRVDTINGAPAEEVAEGTPFEELPASWPTERIALGADDPTLKAIEWLTPFGRGSRVVITGAARAGKSEALRRLAGVLAAADGLEVSAVLAGARPEEIAEWRSGPLEPAAALSFASGAEAQGTAVERAVDVAKRVAARGGHAVVLVDGLDGLAPSTVRKALGAARNLGEDKGSLTLVATATQPPGGETTVIALDAALTQTGRFPALDLAASGTLRPELLVGEGGAEEIARARAEAIGED